MNAAPKPEQQLTDAMLDAATEWVLDLDEPNADRDAFEAWLAEDPRHRVAFRRARAVLGVFDIRDEENPTLMEARKGALTRAKKVQRRWIIGAVGGGAIAAAAAVAIGVSMWPKIDGVRYYSTTMGERRFVTLPDGSRATLDMDTIISIKYSKEGRDLALLKGQARFDVAHDEARPFIVTAAGRAVRATGTAFNVDIMGPKLFVTLLEGHVRVTPMAAPQAKPTLLDPGQQLAVKPGEADHVVAVDPDAANAWQQGMLMFADEPLSDAIERVNRYTTQKLVLADDQTAALKLSGVFNIGSTKAFVEAVQDVLPVAVARADKSEVVLRERSAAEIAAAKAAIEE